MWLKLWYGEVQVLKRRCAGGVCLAGAVGGGPASEDVDVVNGLTNASARGRKTFVPKSPKSI